MQSSPTTYIINHLNVLMMAPLQLKEKPEETCEIPVEGIRVCIECGSPNTTILTKAIYCRVCQIFKLFRQRKSVKPFSKMEIQHRMIPNYMINEWVGKPKENIDTGIS